MPHQSDNANRLAIEAVRLNRGSAVPESVRSRGDVYLIVLPFHRRWLSTNEGNAWLEDFVPFVERLNPNAVVAILTMPEDAACLSPQLTKHLHLQLWIAVKLDRPIEGDSSHLPEHHAALLIWTRYHRPLQHAKTRIAYTFCPVCDKTTKDYGGKKHTYHAYGTLLSDVWRDIAWTPSKDPREIAERLADLFGISPYKRLRMVIVESSRVFTNVVVERTNGRRQVAKIERKDPNVESRLLQGDSLEILKSLPDNSIDLCFADPPYNIDKRYDNWDDALDIRDYFAWCDQWLDELARVLRPGRTCAVLNIPNWAIRHFAHLRKKLQFQNWIAWEGLSLPVRMIMPVHYAIVCFSKGRPRPLPGLARRAVSAIDRECVTALREFYCARASCVQYRNRAKLDDRSAATDLWWDVHRLKHNSRRVDHPCQLPPILMRRLIALFTKPGETVLDPFDGAGTTSLCAAQLDRRYIGIELSKKYHDLAQQRHAVLASGGDPFKKIQRVPKAKNSRVKRIGNVEYRVAKKVLQLEVREIARKIGRLPSRDEVAKLSKHPIRYFDEYFISWGEVCAAARTTGMSETRSSTLQASKDLVSSRTLFDDAE